LFIEESNNTLTGVRGRDEFVEIYLFGAGEAFIEMNCAPGMDRFLAWVSAAALNWLSSKSVASARS
jgi:hypothetical protein